MITQVAYQYISKNITNDRLIEAWNRDDSFHEACIDFMKSEKFVFKHVLNHIEQLSFKKYTEFLKKTTNLLSSNNFCMLNDKWCKARNPKKDDFKDLVLLVNFETNTDQENISYFNGIVDDLESANVKSVFRHIFQKDQETLKKSGNSDMIEPCDILNMLNCTGISDEKLKKMVSSTDNLKIKKVIENIQEVRKLEKKAKKVAKQNSLKRYKGNKRHKGRK